LLVLGTVVALVLPAPGYVAKLGRDEFIAWCADVVWVFTLPAVFLAALLTLHRLLRKSRRRR
jgi:hypothetical protein